MTTTSGPEDAGSVSLERKKQKPEKQNSDRSSYIFCIICLHFCNTLPKINLNPKLNSENNKKIF